MHLIWWMIVGVIAGWITGKIMKGGGYGFWLDLVLGIAGAFVGGFIARHLGLAAHGGFIYTILVATAGAVLVVFLYRLVTKGKA
jgi:Predicted membrane protein